MTRRVASRELVASACGLSARTGVIAGMDLAQARSLLPPHIVVHTQGFDAAQEQSALHALACWALRYSPLAAPDPSGGLFIDITGTELVHRGESRLIRAVASSVNRLGFAVRIAAASTFGCAWAISRFGEHAVARVPPGREREALEGLPVQALRVDEHTAGGLAEIAITSVGDLLKVPRSSLAARFDGILLARLQQALGEKAERIEPVRPVPPPRVELMFDGPTSHWESIESAMRRVVEQLVAEVAAQDRGIRVLNLELFRPHAERVSIEITLSRPSRSIKHIWSLVRTRLERIDVGDGIDGIAGIAMRTAHLRHVQQGLTADEHSNAAAAWGELVDTLAGRLGNNNIARMEPIESHLPERAFRERTGIQMPPRRSTASAVPADRPTMLFARAEPADAISLSPDGPVLSLGWRGRRWNVVSCIGPERIGQEWWRWQPAVESTRARKPAAASTPLRSPPDRDYFAIQSEQGQWLWVYRHTGTGVWFVHGLWS